MESSIRIKRIILGEAAVQWGSDQIYLYGKAYETPSSTLAQTSKTME